MKDPILVSKIIFKFVPKKFRKNIILLFEKVYCKFDIYLSLLFQVRLQGFIIKGKEKHSNEDFTILFIGNKEEKTLVYLTDILFYKEIYRKKIKRIYIWNISKIVKKYKKEVNATFVLCNRKYGNLLSRKGFNRIPKWVSTTLTINEPIEEINKKFKRSVRKNLKKIQNNGYAWEVYNNERLDKLRLFYNDIFQPYLKQKYENLFISHDFSLFRLILECGSLLLIKYKDKYVYGCLIKEINKKTIMLSFAGQNLDKIDDVHNNIGVAATYYPILWAKTNKYKFIDFGCCRAFLNDGVLQYNRKWGVILNKYPNCKANETFNDVFCFKCCKYNKGVESFLLNNPFLTINGENYNSIVFISDHTKLTKKDINHYKKRFMFPNSSKLIFISPKDFNQENWKNSKMIVNEQ